MSDQIVSNRAVKTRTFRLAAVVAVGVALAGCGGGGSTTSAASSEIGAPAEPTAQVSRTVEIHAGDDLRFSPDQVAVKVGETITFKVVNTATVEHDFTLGDDADQSAHEKEMRDMSSGDMTGMGDSPNAIHIPPGQSKTITWTFTKAGMTLYGCHEPGHFASGMRGTITVT